MRKIELLAPGGDLESIKAAIAAGADAIYCGLDKFNARNRAENLSFDDLQGVIRYAHRNNCKVFLTLNIVFVDSEIPELLKILNKLVNTNIDGVIVQDLGLLYLISKYFPSLGLHASTQLTTHNSGQIKFLSRLSVSRVNLSRELNIHEIKSLCTTCHENNMLSEVFVHGSYCISFSGLCYMSSVHGGNSGNRGRCSQPCRDRYETTSVGINYPLNLKDNSAFFDIKKLYSAGVDSLKIEGRIKKSDYVYTVVHSWKEQLGSYYSKGITEDDNSALFKVFNRDFSNSFLAGEINKNMFIDNPRDHSIASGLERLYEDQISIKSELKKSLGRIQIGKAPLSIDISGTKGKPLKVVVKSPDKSFIVLSETILSDKGTEALNARIILKKLKTLNDTEYYIDGLDLNGLNGKLFLPLSELTSIKLKIYSLLNGSKKHISPIRLPSLNKPINKEIKLGLSVLISDEKDITLSKISGAEFYFQLPATLRDIQASLLDLFNKNPEITPWFPSILIGDDYDAAVEFLHELQPQKLVTDNSGIAFEASGLGIRWIAGPHLNITNSHSLFCLKEMFGCKGAFISNEINHKQIKAIRKPEGFDLYFSIYHPIILMTSRQCLSHQVEGCKKSIIDGACLSECSRNSVITNMQGKNFIVEKQPGKYHSVYNEHNYLNTRVINDIPDLFSGYFIDLRDIKTNTEVLSGKNVLVELFQNLLQGYPDSAGELACKINHTTCQQYDMGI